MRGTLGNLSRRERQIMDVIYRRGEASAAEVMEEIPDPPSYSAVRAMLRVLEVKGHLKHLERGLKYVFRPTVARDQARVSALKRVVETFFDNSKEMVMATLINDRDTRLSSEELNRLESMIREAKGRVSHRNGTEHSQKQEA